MPENIECSECGKTVFGYTSPEPRPIGGDECPHCGGTEFEPKS